QERGSDHHFSQGAPSKNALFPGGAAAPPDQGQNRPGRDRCLERQVRTGAPDLGRRRFQELTVNGTSGRPNSVIRLVAPFLRRPISLRCPTSQPPTTHESRSWKR